MKIKILATGQSPDHYTFDGETITAHKDGVTETYDLSTFPVDGKFTSADPVNNVPAIRAVKRDSSGELYVTLCQSVGPGHWSESDWFEASEYNPNEIHVKYDNTQSHAGQPWALTKNGKENV